MTETKSPQWHYEEAERLLGVADDETKKVPSGNLSSALAQAHVASLALIHGKALAHATLAQAGFTRDGAIEQHTHEYMLPNGVLRETEAGRPA